MSEFKPRLCSVVKGPNGFGFHLHGQKGVVGQKIRKVEEGSPAAESGLLAGDRIIAVNGKNVQNESHAEVVACIKERTERTDLLVVDEETYKYYTENNMEITLINNEGSRKSSSASESPAPATKESSHNVIPHPRLCHLVKTTGGFGFNLHSEKAKSGRFISGVESGGPAEVSGLKVGDRIVEVNDVNIEAGKHSDLVNAIKQSGSEVHLLVVDKETDAYFKSLNITPTRKHVDSPPTEADATPAVVTQSSEPDAPVSSPDTTSPIVTSSAPEIHVADDEQPPSPTPEVKPQQNGGKATDFQSMDLSALKERALSGRKKKSVDSSWKNKHQFFNNM